MSKIWYLIQFTIADGKVDEFKKKGDAYVEATRNNEPDTLVYEWWIGEDGKHALLLEEFTSSEALLTHFGNVGPSLPDLLAIAPITRFELFGTANEAAREAVNSLGAVHFAHYNGFQR